MRFADTELNVAKVESVELFSMTRKNQPSFAYVELHKEDYDRLLDRCYPTGVSDVPISCHRHKSKEERELDKLRMRDDMLRDRDRDRERVDLERADLERERAVRERERAERQHQRERERKRERVDRERVDLERERAVRERDRVERQHQREREREREQERQRDRERDRAKDRERGDERDRERGDERRGFDSIPERDMQNGIGHLGREPEWAHIRVFDDRRDRRECGAVGVVWLVYFTFTCSRVCGCVLSVSPMLLPGGMDPYVPAHTWASPRPSPPPPHHLPMPRFGSQVTPRTREDYAGLFCIVSLNAVSRGSRALRGFCGADPAQRTGRDPASCSSLRQSAPWYFQTARPPRLCRTCRCSSATQA